MASRYEWNFDVKGSADADRLADSIRGLTNAAGQYRDSMGRLRDAQGRFVAENNRSAESLTRTVGIWNTWNKGVDFLTKRLSQLGSGLTYIFRKTIEVGGAFEQSEATLRGFLGKGAEPVIQVVKDLGRAWSYTTKQTADAAIELTRAGRTSTQIVSDLPAVLKAASANTISLAEAAKIGSVSSNQFSVSMQTAFEVLTAGAKEAPTTITELFSALKNVGPVAKQLGLDLQDTTAVLAQLAKTTGETAGRAGTRLYMMLTRLAALTPGAKDEIAKLGITLEDAGTGKMLPFTDILTQFHDKMAQIPSDAKKAETLKAIFGEAFSSVIPLINASGQALVDMRGRIEDSRSAMEDLQKLKFETMSQAVDRSKSAVEGFWIALKDILGSHIIAFFDMLASVINRVTDAVEDASKNGGSASKIFSAVQDGISTVLSYLRSAFQKIKEIAGPAWESLMDSEIVQQVIDFGAQVGESLIDGVISGIEKKMPKLKAALDIVSGAEIFNRAGKKEDARQVQTLQDHIASLEARKTTTGDPTRLANIQKQLETSRSELAKLQGTNPPEPAPVVPVIPAVIKPEVPDAAATPDAAASDVVSQEAVDQLLLKEASLKKQQEATLELLNAEENVLSMEQQRAEAQDKLTGGMEKAKLSVIEMGKEFAKWVLEPFDAFQQMVLGIKSKFGSIIDGLKGRRTDIKEKAGLLDEAGVKREKTANAKDTFADLKSQLDLAQSAEEKTAILTKLSDQAMTLNEVTGDKSYAKQAVDFNKQAEAAAKEDRKMKLKAAEIEKTATEDSVPILQRLFQSAGTSGEKAEAGKQLQEALMKLGRADEAATMNEQLQQLTIAQAGEQTKLMQLMVERLGLLVESAHAAASTAKEHLQATKDGVMYTDPEAAFA